MPMIPRVGSSAGTATDVPHCFGNPKYYDANDRDCRQCHARVRCKIRVNNSDRLGSGSGPSPQNQIVKKTETTRTPSVEDGEFKVKKTKTKGWWGALGHNGFLRTVNVFLKEAAFGVEQIPLEPYTDEELEKD